MEWVPRSGRGELAGCIWLGRFIDKARRQDALEIERGSLVGEYMSGKNDYLDAQLLRFLALTDARVCELIRSEPDDAKAARCVLAAGRKTSDDCRAFNRAFVFWNAPFLAMLDADEGHMSSGPYASLLKGFYNGILVPPATLFYRLANRKKRA